MTTTDVPNLTNLTAVKGVSERTSPTPLPQDCDTEALAEFVIRACQKIADFVPYLIELHNRFLSGERDNDNRLTNPIHGCYAWKDFCKVHLNRHVRSIQLAMSKHAQEPSLPAHFDSTVFPWSLRIGDLAVIENMGAAAPPLARLKIASIQRPTTSKHIHVGTPGMGRPQVYDTDTLRRGNDNFRILRAATDADRATLSQDEWRDLDDEGHVHIAPLDDETVLPTPTICSDCLDEFPSREDYVAHAREEHDQQVDDVPAENNMYALHSALQKAIRRGDEREALLAAWQLDAVHDEKYTRSRAGGMWSILRRICAEDIGVANIAVPPCIETLWNFWQKQIESFSNHHEPWRLFTVEAVLVLCRSLKSRLTDHAIIALDSGRLETIVDELRAVKQPHPIPEYAHDGQHTEVDNGKTVAEFIVGEDAALSPKTDLDDPYKIQILEKLNTASSPETQTSTYYVVRRKSDGAYMKGDASFSSTFTDASQHHFEMKFFDADRLEQVRVDATYKLTVVNPDIKPGATSTTPAAAPAEIPEGLYTENFLSPEEADALFNVMKEWPRTRAKHSRFKNNDLRHFSLRSFSVSQAFRGKRLGKPSAIAQHDIRPLDEMPDEMKVMRTKLVQLAGVDINYLSAVGYETEKDAFAWHQHPEDKCRDSRVYIVSLGAPRTFGLRPVCAEHRVCNDCNRQMCEEHRAYPAHEKCRGMHERRKKCKICGDESRWIQLQPAHGSLISLTHEMNFTHEHAVLADKDKRGLRISINTKCIPLEDILSP